MKYSWEMPTGTACVARVEPNIEPNCAMEIMRPYAPFACSRFIIEFVNDQKRATMREPYASIAKYENHPKRRMGFLWWLGRPILGSDKRAAMTAKINPKRIEIIWKSVGFVTSDVVKSYIQTTMRVTTTDRSLATGWYSIPIEEERIGSFKESRSQNPPIIKERIIACYI